jgi:hypothetical protein
MGLGVMGLGVMEKPSGCGSLLQLRTLFWDDRPFHWANLQTNATVDAGLKVNPIPISSLLVFTRSFMDAGNRTSIHTVCYALASIGYDRMCHSFPFYLPWVTLKIR